MSVLSASGPQVRLGCAQSGLSDLIDEVVVLELLLNVPQIECNAAVNKLIPDLQHKASDKRIIHSRDQVDILQSPLSLQLGYQRLFQLFSDRHRSCQLYRLDPFQVFILIDKGCDDLGKLCFTSLAQ